VLRRPELSSDFVDVLPEAPIEKDVVLVRSGTREQ